MPRYVIEREMPDLGKMTPAQLKSASKTSCSVLKGLGPQIQWEHSYVTDNKLYCVYLAESAEALYDHAQCGGFPIDSVAEVLAVVDPTSGE